VRPVDKSILGKEMLFFPFTSSGESRFEHISEICPFIGSEYDGGPNAVIVRWPAPSSVLICPFPDYTKSGCVYS